METHIPDTKLTDPAVQQMNDVIKTCVHCGFCLPTCPTYLETGSELDSPRGRIMLMKGVLEEDLPLDATVVNHIDRCLGCLACVTACPSGVEYNALIDNFRPLLEEQYSRAPMDRFTRWMLMQVLPYPGRFRAAAALGKVGKPFARAMPGAFRQMLSLLPPDRLPAPEALPEITPAVGPRRARVVLMTGCVQSVLEPAINAATVRVLARNGVEVIVPRQQGCCGALANHAGQQAAAHHSAGALLDVFAPYVGAGDVDAIITNAAGCGSTLKEYAHLLPEQHEQAHAFAGKARDVCEFLGDLGLAVSSPIPAQAKPVRVAYHDACHLGHAQGIRSQPRELLMSIPGVQVVELPESDICCGSAGIYNITEPEMAHDLLARKVKNIRTTDADIVATGNIGCLTQIRAGLVGAGQIPVAHTIQILDWAYAGALAASL
jgi:glycolate oxidase iron-sulfur subunit